MILIIIIKYEYQVKCKCWLACNNFRVSVNADILELIK